MSKVALSGDAGGTGTVTLAAPNTNSNVTLNLPAVAGTMATAESTLTQFNVTGSAPVYACRAWVNFDGTKDTTGATSTANTNRLIRASGNVTSVLRNSIGNYTVNFTTALQDTNYAFFVQANPVGSIEQHADAGTAATTSLGVLTRNNSNVFYDADVVRVSIFR
jgi:hypothetical protein